MRYRITFGADAAKLATCVVDAADHKQAHRLAIIKAHKHRVLYHDSDWESIDADESDVGFWIYSKEKVE